MKKLIFLFIACCMFFVACGEKKEVGSGSVQESTENPTEKETSDTDEQDVVETISEFEKYKKDCLEKVSELDYTDENMEEILEKLRISYWKIFDADFEKLGNEDFEKEFVVSISFLSNNCEEGTVGFEIQKIGWDVLEMIYERDEKKFKQKIKELKTIWNLNMEQKLYRNLYTEGQYKIGKEMPVGEYVFFAEDSGYFCVSSDSNGRDIIANENFEYNSIITLKKGDYLELLGCYAVPIKEAKIDKKKAEMLKVGKHIKTGEHKIICESVEEGYYCIYSDSRQQNIKANNHFKKQSYITVKNGEYLLLSRCHIK